MILIQNGKRYDEHKFPLESEFEAEVLAAKETIFGRDTIFIDAKRKIGTKALGNTIPDGFLFDMSDPDNFEFYLVEVELESHDFFNHIFQQITKFFAFFKNGERQKQLVQKLFSTITSDTSLKQQFKKYLGDEEIFKFLNDLIDASQNILLIIDGSKAELPEITDTYSDTWGKMVRVIEVKKFTNGIESILSVAPEFADLEFSAEEPPEEAERKATQFSEDFHLEDVGDNVKRIYQHIKSRVEIANKTYVFNPQKYYISIKGRRNIAFLRTRKKKLRMVIMMPEEELRSRIKHHPVKSLSESVQRFYNGPCGAVDIDTLDNIDEIDELIQTVISNQPPQ